jgi:hypothetical protein
MRFRRQLGTLVERADGMPPTSRLTKAVIEPGAARAARDPPTLADSLMAASIVCQPSRKWRSRRQSSGASVRTSCSRWSAAWRRRHCTMLSTVWWRPRSCSSGATRRAVYGFKHALVQEAAYGALLKRTRQQLRPHPGHPA